MKCATRFPENIKLSAYTLMQGNGWGMDPIPEDAKILNRDGTRGPTACFATDWHASYRQRVLAFAAKVGFYGVETDGQFEGASCSDPSHRTTAWTIASTPSSRRRSGLTIN